MSFLPRPAFVGRGLVIRYQGRTDIPPFIAIREFSGTTDLMGVLRRRAREVRPDDGGRLRPAKGHARLPIRSSASRSAARSAASRSVGGGTNPFPRVEKPLDIKWSSSLLNT
jgi:hypothetical protein